jgi:hypothetical protein
MYNYRIGNNRVSCKNAKFLPPPKKLYQLPIPSDPNILDLTPKLKILLPNFSSPYPNVSK